MKDIDGAFHALADHYERWFRPEVASRHGAPDRWDWGVTASTLQRALQRHERLQALADSLTPEQRAALWLDTSDQAATLRRFVR